MFISFAILKKHFKCPPFLKSCFTLLRANVFAKQQLKQSPTFPTIEPIKFYTFRLIGSNGT